MGRAFKYNVEFDLKPIPIRRQLVWRSLIDWHNPANWQPSHRLPCPKDRIALPEDFILFLNHELDTIELVLPQNGELVLGPQGNVRLLTSDDLGDFEHKCSPGEGGENMEFHPVEEKTPSSWFAPHHWQLVFRQPQSADYEQQQQQQSFSESLVAISNFATFLSARREVASIVPHSERIPCTGDWVHFPTNNGSFKVTIERSSQIPALGLLTIGATQFTSTTGFGEFAKSFRGEMLFRFGDYNHLSIRPGVAGYCGNDAPKRLATICQNAQQGACPDRKSLGCADPITPQGHCCPICASSLVVQRSKQESALSDAALYGQLLAAMRQVHAELPSMRLYGHWLYDRRWQLIAEDLPPEGAEVPSERLNDRYIQQVKSRLESNAKLAKELRLEVASSVEWLEDSHLIGSLIWFFVVLFLLSLAAYPLYTYYQRNRLDPAFTFVRFRSHTSDLNIELEVDPTGAAAVSHTAATASTTKGAPSRPAEYRQAASFPSPSAVPSTFKQLLSPFSASSIASIKSAISGSSSTSLSTNASTSLFPNLSPGSGAGDSSRTSNGLTENFDNPIFRLYQQETAAATEGQAATLPKLTRATSHQSLHSNE